MTLWTPCGHARREARNDTRRKAALIAREYGVMQYKALCLTSLNKAHTILTTADKISALILSEIEKE